MSETEVESLAQRITNHLANRDGDANGLLVEVLTSLTALEAERDKWKDLLMEYGQHSDTCPKGRLCLFSERGCDCGFEAALRGPAEGA